MFFSSEVVCFSIFLSGATGRITISFSSGPVFSFFKTDEGSSTDSGSRSSDYITPVVWLLILSCGEVEEFKKAQPEFSKSDKTKTASIRKNIMSISFHEHAYK